MEEYIRRMLDAGRTFGVTPGIMADMMIAWELRRLVEQMKGESAAIYVAVRDQTEAVKELMAKAPVLRVQELTDPRLIKAKKI